jgi:uncharacterized protein DUF2612
MIPTGDFTNAATYAALITSEHNQKPNFMSMVSVVTGAIGDVTEGIRSIEAGFNLNDAIGAQLDILGLWIGQSRVIAGVLVPGFFGFTDDPEAEPFGELSNPAIGGKWFNLGDTASGNTVLSDPDYLTVLKARIVRNQSNGTLSAIENALAFIFGVPCSVIDNGTLSLVIDVKGEITPTQQALLTSLDILPRPSGISIEAITFVGTPFVAQVSAIASVTGALTTS